MAILEGIGQLSDVSGASHFVKAAVGTFLQYLVHLSPGRVLQDQVDPGLVVKVAEHTQNIFVSQMTLDLNLATQLVLDSGLLQLALEENLEGDDVFAPLLTRQVNVAKLALAKRTPNLKVFQFPTVSGATFGILPTIRVWLKYRDKAP